tara:strand:- start:195 stop:446 length:252 start_codon:yes stop_codon:yes gene_type:complete
MQQDFIGHLIEIISDYGGVRHHSYGEIVGFFGDDVLKIVELSARKDKFVREGTSLYNPGCRAVERTRILRKLNEEDFIKLDNL